MTAELNSASVNTLSFPSTPSVKSNLYKNNVFPINPQGKYLQQAS
jgi:hypothetical protein